MTPGGKAAAVVEVLGRLDAEGRNPCANSAGIDASAGSSGEGPWWSGKTAHASDELEVGELPARRRHAPRGVAGHRGRRAERVKAVRIAHDASQEARMDRLTPSQAVDRPRAMALARADVVEPVVISRKGGRASARARPRRRDARRGGALAPRRALRAPRTRHGASSPWAARPAGPARGGQRRELAGKEQWMAKQRDHRERPEPDASGCAASAERRTSDSARHRRIRFPGIA